jgi:hypothetical protein
MRLNRARFLTALISVSSLLLESPLARGACDPATLLKRIVSPDETRATAQAIERLYRRADEKLVFKTYLEHASLKQKRALKEAFSELERAKSLSQAERQGWLNQIQDRIRHCRIR